MRGLLPTHTTMLNADMIAFRKYMIQSESLWNLRWTSFFVYRRERENEMLLSTIYTCLLGISIWLK